ncbi:toxin-antitoxin system HicB family antitoxin [Kitasatospora sp. NPDC001660]
MDLTPYVENLRNELAVAAGTGGEEARALAERLTLPLESAVRLTLLNALSAATSEITRELAPGSVDVRLRGMNPEFVVSVPPATDAFPHRVEPVVPPMASPVAPVVPPVSEADEGGTARINLRLPAHLKSRAEEAAGQEGLSLNAWLVRVVAGALEGGGPVARPAFRPQPRRGGGQGFTGWVQ